MTLEKKTIPLPFAGGLDTKTDPKQVAAAKLLILENGAFSKPGAISKRYGNVRLSNSLSSGLGLNVLNDELVALSGNSLYSYRSATSVMDLKGTVSAAGKVSQRPVESTSVDYTSPDSAVCNGQYICYVYMQPTTKGGTEGTVYYTIIDAITREYIVKHKALLTGNVSPRVVALGSLFVIFFERTSTQTIHIFTVDSATQVETRQTALEVTDLSSFSLTRTWDVCANSTGPNAFLFWNNGSVIKLKIISSAMSASTVTAVNADNLVHNCQAYDSGAMLLYSATTVPKVASFSVVGAALSTVTSSAVLGPGLQGTIAISGTTVYIWIDNRAGIVTCYTMAFGTGVETTSTVTSAGYMVSEPFVYGSRCYAWVFYDSVSVLQDSHFLLDELGGIHARMAYGFAGGPPGMGGATGARLSRSRGPVVGTGIASTALGVLANLEGVPLAESPQGVQDYVVEFDSYVNRTIQDKAGEHVRVSGGQMSTYDGLSVTEQGFYLSPENVVATRTGGADGTTGVYGFCVVYEWVDNNGLVHRSSPSLEVIKSVDFLLGTDAGKYITVTCTNCMYSAKSGVRAVLYRTENGGAIYYRDTDIAADKGDTAVSLKSSLTDAQLSVRAKLYTTGGELANWSPGPTGAAVVYRGRVFAVDTVNDNQIVFTKPVMSGIPAEFAEDQYIAVDPVGGPVKALGVLDDKLIIFKQSRIYVMTGQGPDRMGLQNDYLDPQTVSSEVGCPYPRSVVQTPAGLMFQSAKGIYLLDRSLSTQYVGAAVEGSLGTGQVLAAVLAPTQTQVRFALAGGTKWLVWDYLVQQWSTFTGLDAAAFAVWNGEACYLGVAGQLYTEDRTRYTDGTAFVQLRLVTAWLQLAGLQGYQRVNHVSILADGSPSHTLELKTYTDFDDTRLDQRVTLLPLADVPVMQRRVHLKNQKCEAIKLEITDKTVTGTDAGLVLSGLAFEIGVKRGLDKLGPTRSN